MTTIGRLHTWDAISCFTEELEEMDHILETFERNENSKEVAGVILVIKS